MTSRRAAARPRDLHNVRERLVPARCSRQDRARAVLYALGRCRRHIARHVRAKCPFRSVRPRPHAALPPARGATRSDAKWPPWSLSRAARPGSPPHRRQEESCPLLIVSVALPRGRVARAAQPASSCPCQNDDDDAEPSAGCHPDRKIRARVGWGAQLRAPRRSPNL
eukprot:scaffold2261_cov405-Prasinococcus_capsulatus_cf.AAC.28